MKAWKTLENVYQSREYQYFENDLISNQLFIEDPERANRIEEHSESGCNGSTHSEVMQDWRDFLGTLKIFDPEYDDIEDIEDYDLHQDTYNAIIAEIDSCEKWHDKNGSLHTIIC